MQQYGDLAIRLLFGCGIVLLGTAAVLMSFGATRARRKEELNEKAEK